jgi:hypothetical protein
MVRSRLARSVKERKGYKKGEYMSKLYYLKYTQENEAYVEAESPEEAVEKITEYTSNGGFTPTLSLIHTKLVIGHINNKMVRKVLSTITNFT